MIMFLQIGREMVGVMEQTIAHEYDHFEGNYTLEKVW